MTRRNRRQRPATPPGEAGRAAPRTEQFGGEEYFVRHITGSASTKAYRCPGCQQLIRPATPHVVAWPKEPGLLSKEGLEERRHWHSPCWSRRERG